MLECCRVDIVSFRLATMATATDKKSSNKENVVLSRYDQQNSEQEDLNQN